MELFQKTPEEYLDLVKNWEDPNPKPIIESFRLMDDRIIHVVRDDYLPYGSKSRYIDYLIGHSDMMKDKNEIVYGATHKKGWGSISASYVARNYNKKATFFFAKREYPTWHQKEVLKLGANIIWVNMGMLTVTKSRANVYCNMDKKNRALIPMGLEHDTVFGSIIKVARNAIDFPISEVWSVAGSGVLNRGLQLAFPDIPCNAVQTGHVLSDRERGRAKLYVSPYKFDQDIPIKEFPPYSSEPFYDAKVWKFVKLYAKNNALVWNVAREGK